MLSRCPRWHAFGRVVLVGSFERRGDRAGGAEATRAENGRQGEWEEAWSSRASFQGYRFEVECRFFMTLRLMSSARNGAKEKIEPEAELHSTTSHFLFAQLTARAIRSHRAPITKVSVFNLLLGSLEEGAGKEEEERSELSISFLLLPLTSPPFSTLSSLSTSPRRKLGSWSGIIQVSS